jgi:hypothetical protein
VVLVVVVERKLFLQLQVQEFQVKVLLAVMETQLMVHPQVAEALVKQEVLAVETLAVLVVMVCRLRHLQRQQEQVQILVAMQAAVVVEETLLEVQQDLVAEVLAEPLVEQTLALE